MKRNTFIISLLVFSLFFSCRKIALQCCVGFCHTSVRISRDYTCIPSLWVLPQRPHSTALGHHRVPGWARCHRATSHQPSVSHAIACTCRYYSFQSSHPILFPLSPRNSSLHLYLHSFPANRFMNTIFLDSV